MLKNQNNTQINVVPMINNLGQVLYLGYGGSLDSSGGLYLATPNLPSPVANFTAIPVRGPVPLTVQFADTSTGIISSRAWGLGDGGDDAARLPVISIINLANIRPS